MKNANKSIKTILTTQYNIYNRCEQGHHQRRYPKAQ